METSTIMPSTQFALSGFWHKSRIRERQEDDVCVRAYCNFWSFGVGPLGIMDAEDGRLRIEDM